MERIVDIAIDGRHLAAHRGFLVVSEERREVEGVPLDEKSQFSAYARFCNGKEQFEAYMRRIEANLPERGDVHILTFTDRQYENIVRFSGQRRRRQRKNPDQLALF